MRKKQSGFTLIELLVTIALMLSILGIAIVSFINISNRKKEEAWNQIKEQIETAAIEYFNSNEYMFEGLGDVSDGIYGKISIGTLVENDYISIVINPVTGEAIPKCAYVEIDRSGNKYSATFDESVISDATETACDSNDSVIVSQASGPEFELEGACRFNDGNGNTTGNNTSDWCYQYDVTPRIINLKGNIDDATVGYCVSNEPMCNNFNDFQSLYPTGSEDEIRGYLDDVEGEAKYITAAINNGNGTSLRSSKIYNIDRTAPSGNIAINSSNEDYNVYNPNIKLLAADSASGIGSVQYLTDEDSYEEYFDGNPGIKDWSKTIASVDVSGEEKQNGTTVVKSIIVKDVVGNSSNVNSNEYKVYSECGETIAGDSNTTTGSCDCETKQRAITTTSNLTDKYTGKSCGKKTSTSQEACTPTGCTATCPTFTYSGTTNNGYYVGSSVSIRITPNSSTDTWEWFSNDVKTGNYVSWGTKTGTQTVSITGEGTRRLKVIITNSAGNSKTCYSSEMKIDRTAPNCPAFSYSGTKGDNGWYRSSISITVNPTSDTASWQWYTNQTSNGSWKYWSNNTGKLTKSISTDGKSLKGQVIVSDAAGNKRTCTISAFNIDKTAPTMSITYGPKKEKCGSKYSIRTKYTANDATSGLSVVKDYYGYDSSLPSASSSYWRNRSITAGASSYSHDHNWGPTCTTMGTPGSGRCYKLKYYLKDRAGNVRTGMTSSCATY